MGIFSDYLQLSFTDLEKERKKQLGRISSLREGRPVLTYAASFTKKAPVGIEYDDCAPIMDQIGNIEGDEIDVIIETPGGFAEAAEDIVNIIRNKFSSVGMIVPGQAKSAGTIFVMAGDEILMDAMSALGPIDAQFFYRERRFSAFAYLEWLDTLKKEVDETGKLNLAYIPILQSITPGDIQSCKNALKFSVSLVTKLLSKYKFKFWKEHSSTGKIVTDEEKKKRAEDIAKELCKHSRWLSHGCSIRIDDLIEMGLKITDFSKHPELNDAIRRYYFLMKLTLDKTNIFKIFETPNSQLFKRIQTPQVGPPPIPKSIPETLKSKDSVLIDIDCPNCGFKIPIQMNFKKGIPLKEGFTLFPKNNIISCGNCKGNIDLTELRKQIEKDMKRKII